MIARLLLLCMCLLCAACATRPPVQGATTMAAAAQTKDPLEPYNRKMTKLNSGLTRFVIKPVLSVYRTVIPRPLRKGISNISANARAPLTFVHDILQGEADRAFVTLGRFMMNSTVGLGGLLDPAAASGLPAHDEDAGQTFARWGIPSGPYIVLPLLGPSTLRDGIGFGADIYADPLRYVLRGRTSINITAVEPVQSVTPFFARGLVVDRSSSARGNIGTGLLIASILSQLDQNVDRLNELQRGSVDPYVAVREAYFQYRQAEIDNGRTRVVTPEDDPLNDVLDTPK